MGAAQVIAVADSGVDFDHCMVWQQSFPFPCYDPAGVVPAGVAGAPLDLGGAGAGGCGDGPFAALLANPDFVAFAARASANDELARPGPPVPLLDGGSAQGFSLSTNASCPCL